LRGNHGELDRTGRWEFLREHPCALGSPGSSFFVILVSQLPVYAAPFWATKMHSPCCRCAHLFRNLHVRSMHLAQCPSCLPIVNVGRLLPRFLRNQFVQGPSWCPLHRASNQAEGKPPVCIRCPASLGCLTGPPGGEIVCAPLLVAAQTLGG